MTTTCTPKQVWNSRIVEPAHNAAGNEVVFVRSRHFYETFDEHAKIAARTLGLALTCRGGLAMAGFPFHHVNSYVAKLVASGYRVVLIDAAG